MLTLNENHENIHKNTKAHIKNTIAYTKYTKYCKSVHKNTKDYTQIYIKILK